MSHRRLVVRKWVVGSIRTAPVGRNREAGYERRRHCGVTAVVEAAIESGHADPARAEDPIGSVRGPTLPRY
jgi:hypothetical protein